MRNRLTDCINKGGGHYTRYGLTINVIICSCLYLFSKKGVNWGGLFSILARVESCPMKTHRSSDAHICGLLKAVQNCVIYKY